ncbi:hypothetical protein [Methylobacillus glycogenes]|uniref:hypothetical protein n=1 Tax=Methylobacillus glycogenes TaxID=406 RepID=UPI00046F5B34|nr:hypothetical protein [Methylobacillus glycogenes]
MVSSSANQQNETTGSFSDLVLKDHDAAGHELLVGLHAIALGFAEHENLPQQALLQQADRRASWHALWVALSVGDKARHSRPGIKSGKVASSPYRPIRLKSCCWIRASSTH